MLHLPLRHKQRVQERQGKGVGKEGPPCPGSSGVATVAAHVRKSVSSAQVTCSRHSVHPLCSAATVELTWFGCVSA